MKLFHVQLQRGGVDAIAFSCWLWPVRKYMAQMCSALFAAYFHTYHAVTGVGMSNNVVRLMWLPKTRPTRAGIKLG